MIINAQSKLFEKYKMSKEKCQNNLYVETQYFRKYCMVMS